jgi:hypothetical protein
VVTVDGAPAIRISGEMFGALTSREEYGDFHLRLEFKWGEKKWPPKEGAARDSGILYYAVGEPGAADNKAWMRSLECQVQEHDTGDFWAVGGTTAEVAGDAEGEGKDRKMVHRPGAPVVTVGVTPRRAIKALDNEKPTGEWNAVEVICLRGTCVHVVNGKTNLVLTNPRQPGADGAMVPLTKGRLQIQSEGAEVFYRNIQVRPITPSRPVFDLRGGTRGAELTGRRDARGRACRRPSRVSGPSVRARVRVDGGREPGPLRRGRGGRPAAPSHDRPARGRPAPLERGRGARVLHLRPQRQLAGLQRARRGRRGAPRP